MSNREQIKQVKQVTKEINSNIYRRDIIRNTVIKQISNYSPKFNCKITLSK